VREPVRGILQNFLWENKQTSFESFRLSIKLWEEIEEKAYSQGNIPAMQIELHPPTLPRPLKLVVLAEDDFITLKEMAEKGRDEDK